MKISTLIFVLISQRAFGVEVCQIFEWVGNSDLKDRAEFWTDYGTLGTSGAIDEKRLLELVAKHAKKDPAEITAQLSSATKAGEHVVTSTSAASKYRPTIRKNAEKGMDLLPPAARGKADAALRLMQEKGTGAIADLKVGGYQMEFIKQEGVFSIRLDRHYRMTFTEKEGIFAIVDVGKKPYRH